MSASIQDVLLYLQPELVPNSDYYAGETGFVWLHESTAPTLDEIDAARPAAAAAAARAAMPTLTPAQLDLALLQFGLLDAVEAYVAAADRETQIAYKKVKTFKRSNRLLNTAAGLLGMTDEQVDAVWMYGAALEPGE